MGGNASDMKPLVIGSTSWKKAVQACQDCISNGVRCQIKVQSSSHVTKFLKEVLAQEGNTENSGIRMNRYHAQCNSSKRKLQKKI